MKAEYTVIYYPDGDGWGAEVPDLSGCFTCGDSLDEVRGLVKEAIETWIRGRIDEGRNIPKPSRMAETVIIDVAVA
jgi:predicted RNase H-like HicB family nuclease